MAGHGTHGCYHEGVDQMSGEKTEQPTPKRLREARKKGQVAKSKEISTTVSTLGVFFFLWLFQDYYGAGFRSMIVAGAQGALEPFDAAFPVVLHEILVIFLKLTVPLLLVVIFCDVASNFFQVGFLFAFETIKPDLKKLNPMEKVKQIVSKKNLLEFVKSVVKVVCLAITVTLVIRLSLPALVNSPYGEPSYTTQILRTIVKMFIIYVAVAFIILAAADYYFQKRQHMKGLMMTKQEVKQEYKEMEGDPIIKGKRRQLHQELLTNNMLQNVKKATVVVTNPTHRAVALYYEKEKTKLPMIVAKGENLLARRIVEIARDEGIPIMHDVPLAQALYEKGHLDNYIPSDLIEPVAEILKWVYKLKSADSQF